MREALRRLVEAPIAHRGLHGCGRPGGPIENSIGAAHAAIACEYGIECDIVLSRDGEAMVFHDEQLERLTKARDRVADYDANALSTIALGDTQDRIPTLAVFLAAVAGRVPVVVEIKSLNDGDLRLTDRALAVVAAYDGPVAFESFDPAIVAHALTRRHLPHPVGLVGPMDDEHDVDASLVEACDFLSWSIDALSTIAARFPAKPLTTWTVRTPAHVSTAARYRAQIVFEGFQPDLGR